MVQNNTIPLVSVVMPAYNVENYIVESVNSILSQTFKDFEFIIINDGSTDNTFKLLKFYEDPRIIIINNEINEGNYFSRNKGCNLAKGKYICVMDADDIAYPNRLEVQVKFMETNSNILLSGSAYKLLGQDVTIEQSTKFDEIKYILISTFCVLHPTVIFRRDLVKKIGFYNVKYEYASDYDLVTRLALLGEITNVPDVLLSYRQHNKQISSLYSDKQQTLAREIQYRYQQQLGMSYHLFDKNIFLNHLASYLKSTISYIQSSGLFYGRIGLVLFFYHYSKYSKNIKYAELADLLLSDIVAHVYKEIPVSLNNGLCGLGMAISYLFSEGFVDGDEDDVLFEIDKQIEKNISLDNTDLSFETGILGVLYYLVCRLSRTKRSDNFSSNFKNKVYIIAEELVYNRDSSDGYNIAMQYVKCMQGEPVLIDWSEFFQKIIFSLPENDHVNTWFFGLRKGCAGVGLHLIKDC